MAKINFDKTINLTSLLIALVSLIVSVIALKVSENALVLSSGDFKAQFNYKFHENGDITVENQFHDLFQIDFFEVLDIKSFGVEDHIKKGVFEVLYISKSKHYDDFYKKRFGEKVVLTANENTPCALEVCSYDQAVIDSLESKLDRLYPLGSEQGFMPPSLYGTLTYVVTYYTNKNGERNCVILCRRFFHGGGGYEQFVVSQKEFDEIKARANLPKFGTIDSLWAFIKKKNFSKY